MPAPDHCPNCGAELSPNARACPDCGSDERTGWSERAAAQRLDLPDEQFDYEHFTRREFGAVGTPNHRGATFGRWVVTVLLALVVAWILLKR
jgi:hypothetical protein